MTIREFAEVYKGRVEVLVPAIVDGDFDILTDPITIGMAIKEIKKHFDTLVGIEVEEIRPDYSAEHGIYCAIVVR